MLLGGAVEAVALVSLLVPLRRRLLGHSAPRVEGPFARHPVVGLIEPLATSLDRLIVVGEGTRLQRAGRFAAAFAVFVAPLLALSLVPLGVHYQFPQSEFALVAVRLDGGLAWLVVSMLVGLYGATTLLPDPALRVRFGVMTASFSAAAGFSVAALAIVFGDIDPLAIALAQDSSLHIGHFFGPALPALQRLELPAWGVFLQPVSFVVFVICALAIPRPGNELVPDNSDEASSPPRDGVEAFLVDCGRDATALVVAAWFVALFLGGGAIPFAPADTIIGFISPYFGVGLATILCMGIHIAVFVTKLMLVTLALDPLQRRLDALTFERALGLCWRYAIPLALLNVFVTAQWFGGALVLR
ncbi:MAG: NADH-quinone oxidoreductase subunit H [Myxococcota bacterium]|nr:NADH-quinone oxidoreductase subunit H [Myxococcota bacterium]